MDFVKQSEPYQDITDIMYSGINCDKDKARYGYSNFTDGNTHSNGVSCNPAVGDSNKSDALVDSEEWMDIGEALKMYSLQPEPTTNPDNFHLHGSVDLSNYSLQPQNNSGQIFNNCTQLEENSMFSSSYTNESPSIEDLLVLFSGDKKKNRNPNANLDTETLKLCSLTDPTVDDNNQLPTGSRNIPTTVPCVLNRSRGKYQENEFERRSNHRLIQNNKNNKIQAIDCDTKVIASMDNYLCIDTHNGSEITHPSFSGTEVRNANSAQEKIDTDDPIILVEDLSTNHVTKEVDQSKSAINYLVSAKQVTTEVDQSVIMDNFVSTKQITTEVGESKSANNDLVSTKHVTTEVDKSVIINNLVSTNQVTTEVGESKSEIINNLVSTKIDKSAIIYKTVNVNPMNNCSPTKDDVLIEINIQDALRKCTMIIPRIDEYSIQDRSAKSIAMGENVHNPIRELNTKESFSSSNFGDGAIRIKTLNQHGHPKGDVAFSFQNNLQSAISGRHNNSHNEEIRTTQRTIINRQFEEQTSAIDSLGPKNEQSLEKNSIQKVCDHGCRPISVLQNILSMKPTSENIESHAPPKKQKFSSVRNDFAEVHHTRLVQTENAINSENESNNADSQDSESGKQEVNCHIEIENSDSHEGTMNDSELTHRLLSNESGRQNYKSLRNIKRKTYTIPSESEDSDNVNEDSDGSSDLDSIDEFLTLSKHCKHCKRNFKHVCIRCKDCKTYILKGSDHSCIPKSVFRSTQSKKPTSEIIQNSHTDRKRNLLSIRNDFTKVRKNDSPDGTMNTTELTHPLGPNESSRQDYMLLRNVKRRTYKIPSESEDSDNVNDDSDDSYDLDSDNIGSLSDSDDESLTLSNHCKHCKRNFKHVCIRCKHCKTYILKGSDHSCIPKSVFRNTQSKKPTSENTKNDQIDVNLSSLASSVRNIGNDQNFNSGNIILVIQQNITSIPTSVPNSAISLKPVTMSDTQVAETKEKQITAVLPSQQIPAVLPPQQIPAVLPPQQIPTVLPIQYIPAVLPTQQLQVSENNKCPTMKSILSQDIISAGIKRKLREEKDQAQEKIPHVEANKCPTMKSILRQHILSAGTKWKLTEKKDQVREQLPLVQNNKCPSLKIIPSPDLLSKGIERTGVQENDDLENNTFPILKHILCPDLAPEATKRKLEDGDNDTVCCAGTDIDFNSPKTFKCSSCGEEFSSEWILGKHLCNMEPDIDLDLGCVSVTGITITGNTGSREELSADDDVIVCASQETVSIEAHKTLNTDNRSSGKSRTASCVPNQPVITVPASVNYTHRDFKVTKVNHQTMTKPNTSCVFVTPGNNMITTPGTSFITPGSNMITTPGTSFITPGSNRITTPDTDIVSMTKGKQIASINTTTTLTQSPLVFLTPVTQTAVNNKSLADLHILGKETFPPTIQNNITCSSESSMFEISTSDISYDKFGLCTTDKMDIAAVMNNRGGILKEPPAITNNINSGNQVEHIVSTASSELVKSTAIASSECVMSTAAASSESVMSTATASGCAMSTVTSSSECVMSTATVSSECVISTATASPGCVMSTATVSSGCVISTATASPECVMSAATVSSECVMSAATVSSECVMSTATASPECVMSAATISSECVVILSGSTKSGGSKNRYQMEQGVGNKAAVTPSKTPLVPHLPKSIDCNICISSDEESDNHVKNKTILVKLHGRESHLLNDLSNRQNSSQHENILQISNSGERLNEACKGSHEKEVQDNSVYTDDMPQNTFVGTDVLQTNSDDTGDVLSSDMATIPQNASSREKRQTQCPYCKKSLLNKKKKKVKRHLEICPKFSYYCNICHKGFIYKTVFDHHALAHLSPSQRKAENINKCLLCGIKLSSRMGLLRHLRHVHENVPRPKPTKIWEGRYIPCMCEICGKSVTRNFLKLHMSTHTGQKDFQCDICGHKCNRRDNLITHRRMHTGEKPFECDVCGKTFTRGDNMKNHIRKMHT